MALSFFGSSNSTKKDEDKKNTTTYTSDDEDEEEEEESTSSTTVAEEEQPMTLVQNGNGSAITGETEEETQSTTDNRRFAVENIRSAYQENLASQTPDITETDTRSNYIKTLGQIGQIMKQDNAAGNEILNNFNLERLNSESEFYAPYSTYTNSAVEYLTQRGFDVNKINDETYRAYSGYLQYNGDTNTPSKPNKKKGTQEEWDAYYLYQYGKAVSDTDSVDKEWAAMQEEIAYWTNSGLNLSDQDIYDRVTSDENMKKYPTLRKLDESMSDPGKALMELNHGTDYSKDNIYGVIWSARNNGGTGDAMANTMLYSMGEGNQYVYDEEKAQKLNWNDKTTYSPYEVGMTLEDEGLYFGKDSFSNEDVEELRRTIDPNNPTDLKNYQAVAAANENTNKAEEQLANLNAEVDKWIQKGYSEERILKKVNDMLGDSDYNMLAAIDNSIENGTDLLKTTRPVNYKKSEFVQSITDRIAERNSVPTGDDALANINAPKTADEIDREATILAEESKPEVKTEEIDTETKGGVAEVPEGKKLSSPTDLEESEETSVQTEEENAEAVATGSNKTAQGTDLQETESAPAEPETNVAGITEQEKKAAYDTVHGEGAYERDIKAAGDTNTPRVKTPQEIAEQNQNNRIIVVSDRLTGKMSEGEQQYFNAYPGIEGERIADTYYNLKLDVIGDTNATPTEQTSALPEARVLIGRVATKQAVKADDNYISTSLSSLALRTDYEAKMKEAESVQAEIDAIDERYGTLMTAKKEIPQEVVITPVENLGLAVRYKMDENGEYKLDEVITVDADPIDSEAAHTAYLNSKGITDDQLIENLIEDSQPGVERASEYANGVREARDKINETVEMMTLEDLDSGATLDVPYVSDGKGGYTLSPDFNSRSEEVQKYLEMTGETEDQLWQAINDQINYDLNTDPSQEEYNKLQARLESLNTYLAENNEAYNKANDELFTADAKRGRINDASIRLSGSGVDPLVADEVISVASRYQTSQVPATDHIGLIWELVDAYKFEEFSDAYREGLGATSTKCAEQAADLRGFVESYGNVIPDDIKSNMLAQADYYDSQSRLISDFLITKDENFQELATAGRNNHGLESRLTMEALGVGLDMMTSTEQDIFYALYEKDGKEAAVQFYDDIKGNLIQRANVSIEEGTKEFAESGIAGRAFNELFSIASAIPETFLSAGYLLESLIYGEGDDWLMTLSDAAKKANESTVNELKDIYQGTVWETVIPELTQMINNRGRSMAVGFTFGGLIPEGTSDIVHAFPISTIAFAEAYQDAKENGLEDWQAWSLGAVNFLCESVTEGIEFGHYDEAFKDGLSLKTFTEYFGDKIKGLDWLSEGTGETLNNVLERAFNRWIAGDKSEHNAKVQQYIDAGLADNEKDAQMLVMADYIKEDAHTFIVSALSSFMDLGTFVGGKLMSTVDYAIELQDYRRMGDETTTIKDLQNRDRQIYQAQQKAAETAEKNVAPAETVSEETATGENTTEETAVENQQEGTQEQEQQPQANPEMNPANVSAEIQVKQQIEYDTDLTILENADGTNQTSRTATVAAVMRVDARNLNRAGAAAVALTTRDGDNTIGTLQTILDGGSKSGTNINTLKLGLQYAMLANGECRSVMESESFQNAPSEEKAQMLARAALTDARSETVANEVKTAVHEFRVDEETKRLMTNSETADALDKSEDKVLEKKSIANAAQTNLENRQADEETKAQAAKEANDLATSEPTPQNTDMAVHAVNEQTKAIEMTEQAKQTVANTTQEAQDAIDADDRLQQKTYDDIRQQAETNVFEMEQQEAADAAVAEQNRQAEERRQSEEKRQQMVADQRSGKTEEESVRAKIERLAADRGYTGDEAQKFVDEVYSFWDSGRFSNIDTTKQLSESESWLMMGALSRKFGVNVVISKDMNQNDNGSYNASTNTITLNGNLSAGQIMIDFALHEFTHSLEQTGAYTQYSDTVLGIMFGSEAELNDAIAKKMSDYDANGHPIDDAQARRELVAEFTRTNLNDKETVYRMVDSGLGGRIRNFLHNINQFLKNQKLTGQDKIDAENLRKAERLFQKAINERSSAKQTENNTEQQAVEYSANETENNNINEETINNGNNIEEIEYSSGEESGPGQDLVRQDELRQALIDAGVSVQRSNTNTAYSSANRQAQRQFGNQTAQQSNALHQDVKDYLYTHSTYTPDTNNEQIDRAMGWVQSMASQDDPDGYNAALREVSSDTFDYRSADGQARMLTVMSMAALKAENAETADARQAALNDELSLADAYNKQGTDLGRMLQARKIFRLMTPVGRQAVLLKMTDQINNEYAKEGKTTRVTLSDLTLRAAADAKTEEEFDNVRKAAASELAEQMPANWKEKLVAWRMLSMLGNVRTHVRNVLGNFAFVPVVGIKNKIGAVSEIIGGVKQGNRTKTLGLASKEARSFAKQDAVDMRQTLTGESKYNDGTLVQQERKAFGQGNSFFSKTIGKTVQAISDANSWALEAEDWVFLKGHYQRALAGYMTANNLTADDMKGQTLEKAREYAVNEAQKATYRDANELASKLSNFSKGSNNKALKTAQFVLNAVLPFKKTPANILRRGVEYSPAGLISSAFSLKNVKQYVDYQEGKLDALPENAMSPTQWIDKFASGLTGTAVTALGYLLASKGIVKAGFDDDDEIDKLKGEQEYSLRFSIGDTDVSFTIDWAAPVCMPFFVGASIFSSDKAEAGDADDETIGKMVSDRISSLMHITEPVFNLSMLDGVSSLLNVSQSGDDTITQIAAKILANYGTSFVPTLSGQVARSVDTTRRQAYTQSGMNVLDRTFASAWEQVENKIPYLSKSNIPYRNAFGEADVNSQGWAIIENFISPGYGNVVNEDDPVLNELDRMYKSTGDKGMLPKMPQKYMTVDGEKMNLTAEQYDQLTVERGQTAKTTLEKLFQTPEYLIADDATKADMISDVWTYANQVGHNSVDSGSSVDKWVESASKSDNAVSAIVDRAVERNKKDYATGHKESLIESINGNDLETALTDIEAIKEAGTSEQSIKTTLTNKFKPIYQEAIMSDDEEQWEKAENIMSILEGLGIYSEKTLKSWNNIDYDEDEDEEEKETDNSRWLSR